MCCFRSLLLTFCFAVCVSGLSVAQSQIDTSVPANAQNPPPSIPPTINVPNPSDQPAPSPESVNGIPGAVSSGDVESSVQKGFSSYTTIAGNHDSSSGWSTVLDSSVRYDFNGIFGVELGVPLYLIHNGADSSVVVRANTNPPLVTTYNSLGDVALMLNFAAPASWVGYRSTITGTGPTGDTSYGVSTGRPTFDLNNHFEHSFDRVTPLLEFGIGDSSALINKRVRRPYTTLGPLSHFKAGMGFDLFKPFSFQADAYESLPIGNQKVYSHLIRRSATGPIVRVTKTGVQRFRVVRVSTGEGINEDNGCEGTLSMTLGEHLDLSATYDRSFRQKLDTVSITVGLRIGKTQPKHNSQ